MPKKTLKTKKTKLPAKLVKYLEKAGVKHEILEHRTVYTAFDAATTMKKKLGEIAKSLLIKADKDYYLAILPADYNLDFKKLGQCIGAQTGKPIKTVKIPGEKIMESALKVKAGALSAFGGLHKAPVIMDKGLLKVKKAVFSSGSFNHSIEMAVKEFVKMENALLGSFGVKKKVKIVKAGKVVKNRTVVKKKSVNKKK
ncbi:YbaK/EbsC family protein [Patescibacteria group bacterium]|nr:YbaK/EbsC family protein [Patescibacteria group bacterium]MBU4601188.1 YbaK/EbsC family protein [Patescibacteria group bacterium]MCG2698061.1 YbaK/EbsC family protein [Candidatus Parcubacteria bacterium]